jgi:hypothetical protein
MEATARNFYCSCYFKNIHQVEVLHIETVSNYHDAMTGNEVCQHRIKEITCTNRCVKAIIHCYLFTGIIGMFINLCTLLARSSQTRNGGLWTVHLCPKNTAQQTPLNLTKSIERHKNTVNFVLPQRSIYGVERYSKLCPGVIVLSKKKRLMVLGLLVLLVKAPRIATR